VELLKEGFDVVAFDNLSNSVEGNLNKLNFGKTKVKVKAEKHRIIHYGETLDYKI